MKKPLILLTTLLVLTSPAAAKSFSDIDQSSPYFVAISYLSQNEIINGYPDGSFGPFKDINRAELLKILMSGQEEQLSIPKTNCFPDVPYTEWYAKYVCSAKELGYVQGYPDGTFKPEQSVNKVEALKMLGEIHQWDLSEAENQTIFTDTPKYEWYAPYLQYAKMRNLLPDSGGKYYPSSNITRGSIAETLYRLLAIKELEKEKFDSEVNTLIIQNFNIPSLVESVDDKGVQAVYLTGIITNATSSKVLADTTITHYDQTGDYISHTTSDVDGNFTLNSSGSKNDYLIFSKENYYDLKIPLNQIETESHIALSQKFTTINPEDLRIVLTWGPSDIDLDAHLLTPDEEEIFFMHRINSNLSILLDLDSTTANGTETITIKELSDGEYEYFVHNYAGEESFHEADARVEIYDKNGLAKIFYPPENDEAIWKVFNLDATGKIITVNQSGNCDLLNANSTICPDKDED